MGQGGCACAVEPWRLVLALRGLGQRERATLHPERAARRAGLADLTFHVLVLSQESVSSRVHSRRAQNLELRPR